MLFGQLCGVYTESGRISAMPHEAAEFLILHLEGIQSLIGQAKKSGLGEMSALLDAANKGKGSALKAEKGKKGKRVKKAAFLGNMKSGEEIESVNLVNAKSQALVEGLIELEAAKFYLDHVRILIFPTCRNCLNLSPFLID